MTDNKQWERYIKYLIIWAIDHEDIAYEDMSPACYDEFCENDDESEYYNDMLDYPKMESDFYKLIKKWEKTNE